MSAYYSVAARSCQESGAMKPEATTHTLPDTGYVTQSGRDKCLHTAVF
jgi:hypothetical protein